MMHQDALVTEDVLTLLRALPKLDLHAHLTGSLRPSTVAELAGVSRAVEQLKLPAQLDRYSDFFAPWDGILARVPDTPDTAYRMLIEAAEDFSSDGVRYAEFRVSARRPLLGGYFNEWVDALGEAASSAQRRHNFSTGLILGFAHQRFGSWDDAERLGYTLLENLTQRRDHLVVGLDLWGDESLRPRGCQTVSWLKEARLRGFLVSLHLGEVGAARALVARTLLNLQPHRISHGPALSNSPRLLNALKERRILTEVCLTSNEVTQSPRMRSAADRAFVQLMRSGAPFAICTDDPAIFGTTLSREMCKALFSGLTTVDDLVRAMKDGIELSFAQSSLKARWSAELESVETRATLAKLRSILAGWTSSRQPGR
jgi:adenosine deaminase